MVKKKIKNKKNTPIKKPIPKVNKFKEITVSIFAAIYGFAGMLVGLTVGTWYLIHVRTGGAEIWGVTQLTFGIHGALASLVSMIVVSLATKAPDAATMRMVDEVRIPSGKTVLGKQH